MTAFLVAFENYEGDVESQVVHVWPGRANEVALTLFFLLPHAAAWISGTPLLAHAAPLGAPRRSRVTFIVDSAEEDSIVLEHDSPVEATEHVRGVEANIRAALGLNGSVCVVACEPIFQEEEA